jgi:hypothetical protein
MLTELQTEIPVKEERTAKLFAPGTCRQTAIYCGWYSLKKYVDAFELVDGAIGDPLYKPFKKYLRKTTD